MLNKKLLAASIAASLTAVTAFNAAAAVDLNAGTGKVMVASESITAADLNGDGDLQLTNTGNLLDATVDAGFSIAAGTSKYIRFDVVNGEFPAALTPANISSDLATDATYTVSQGGTTADTFVIFEVEPQAGFDVAQSTRFTFTSNYDLVDQASALSLSYQIYESASLAVAGGTEGALIPGGVSGDLAEVGDAISANWAGAAANTLTAIVAEGFMQFTGPTQTGTLASIGSASFVSGTWYEADLTSFDDTDLDFSNATLTFAGDFSYGEFSYGTDTFGDGVAETGTAVDNLDGTYTVDYVNAATAFGVDTLLEVAVKDTYSVTLDGIEVTATGAAVAAQTDDTAGTVQYDTTSIRVPYVTTFSDYNQRIYITNKSTRDVTYTTSWTTEPGTTANVLAGSSGTIPADTIMMIRATDMVEFTGATTRGFATIEVEAQAVDVEAVTQIVNLIDGDGATDTVLLTPESNDAP